ncbi:MAG: hypothetical protein J6U13_09150 [Salinivirgaceae bacterium]|nr:hypothetical protein [Salinivirgaceae bacterium]
MRVFNYIRNQIRHDRDVKAILENYNSQSNKRFDNIALQYHIDRFRDKTIHSTETGISDEKYCDYEVIVSLTTFGERIHNVHLAIESIMQGTIKPNKIVLWLAEDEFKGKTLPRTLLLQQKRGLEIEYCKDVKSFNKLIPSLIKYPDACIITIDDDVMYEYDIVERLINSHKMYSNTICACRMHRIILEQGMPINYMKWNLCISDNDCSALNFPTGVGGILYPPHCFNSEVFNSEVFMKICPKADDIWFYAMALINGTKSIWVNNSMPDGYYFSLPINSNSLSLQNTISNDNNDCGNDKQFNAMIKEYNLMKYWK